MNEDSPEPENQANDAPTRPATHRRILGAMMAVGGLLALVKAVALAKEVVVARSFGTSPELDAFRIASAVPEFAMNVVAGALHAALIPAYVELRERRGAEEAGRLFAQAIGLSLVLLLSTSVLLALSSPWLVRLLGSGFAPDTSRLTLTLFLLLLPMVTLSGLCLSSAAILNAHERYALPAAVPLLSHVLVIVLLVVGPRHWGVFALAAGMLAGLVAELSLLSGALERLGLRLRPRLSDWDESTRRLLREWGLLASSLAVAAGALLIDRGMAASLPPGSVARLDYGNKVAAGVLTIAAHGLAVPILPHFSRLVAHGDWAEVQRTLKRFAALVLFIGVPATLLLIALSRPIVRLLFERGAFTAQDGAAVTAVQQFYLLQVPGFVLMILAGRLLMSLRRSRILLVTGAVALVLNVVGNLVFMRLFGLAGIALSTAVVQTAMAITLFAVLGRLLKHAQVMRT